MVVAHFQCLQCMMGAVNTYCYSVTLVRRDISRYQDKPPVQNREKDIRLLRTESS